MKIALFEQKEIRKVWNSEIWDWYFSIIDIIEVLTESPRPRKYWSALKTKLIEEWSELSLKLGQLKMLSQDWKMRITDVWNTQTMTKSEYKDYKWLKKESLKDNMTNLELVLEMLAEASTTEIIKTEDSKWFNEIKKASKSGWEIAWNARKELEQKTKKKIISKQNFIPEKNKLTK